MLSIPALLLLLAHSAVAESPEDYKNRFATQEKILLTAVLTDPASRAEFAQDAAAGAPISKWQAKIALYAESWLARPHEVRLKDANGQPIRDLKNTVEPGEWAALLESLKALSAGGMIDRAKAEYFSGRLLAADKALKEGNPQPTHEVIAMGREQLSTALKEYVASEPAKAALAAHRQELERRGQSALDQARQASEAGGQASQSRSPEQAANGASGGFENRGGQGAPVVPSNPGIDTLAPPPGGGLGQTNVDAPRPGAGGRNSYTLGPVPSPGGNDLDELEGIKKKSGGILTTLVKFAPAIGAGLGVLLASLFGFGLLLMAAMAAAGAFGGSFLQKKFGA